jgi:HEAT repeat protein
MDRLLRLSPDERGTVALAASTAFLSAGGLTIAASSIDALVFARYGVDRLPTLYLLLGGTMFVASLGISAMLGRLGRGRSFLAIPLAIGLLAGGARIALLGDATWIYPLLWILRGAAEFLLGLAVWGLAGLVTDTRQAKRFFPLVGGAAVLGQVLGGLATKPLASWIGADNMIIVWMGALLAIAVLGRRLVMRAGSGGTPRKRSANGLAELREGLRDVRRSRLLRWMSLGSVLFSTLFFSLYLPFSRAATDRYPRPEDLAGFFGLFFAVSTAVTLVLSLLVMNRMLSRLGIPVVMLILPFLYLVAFGTLTLTSTFAILLVFRFAQVVWLQGGASSAWEAVINTVPAERRDRMRAFLYGGPTQVGTVLAGLVAMIGQGAVSPRVLFGIGLAAAAAALSTMWRVRRAYADELVLALREGRPHVFGATSGHGEPFGVHRVDRAAVAVAVRALSADPDAWVRRVAAELLGDLEAAEATTALGEALQDGDDEVRATALRSLVRSGRFEPTDEIPALLADPFPEVRLEAVEALGRFRADWQRARALLGDPDGLVRAAAARLLLERGAEDPDIDAALAKLARSPHADARAAALGALTTSRSARALEIARTGLSDPAPSVRIEAVRAVTVMDPATNLGDLVQAIVGGGAPVLEAAADILSSAGPHVEEPVRRLAAESTERARARRRLADSIDAGGGDRLEMLRDSLLAASERDAETAIRSIALLGDRGSISTALENLSAGDPAQRANALEVIETLGDQELVRPLLALWDRERTQERDEDWRAHVARDPDGWIRACAAWATGAGRDTGEERGGTMTETLATMPVMERVLFLRRVPLFTDLPPQDLKPIASIATEHSFADADTIAEQGDTGDEMHVIVSGYVIVIVREPGGHQEVIAVRSEGDVIGEMAVITSAPRMASLAAKGPVRLLTIARRHFEAVLRERPETSLALMRVLCERLAHRTGEPAGIDPGYPTV